MLHEIATCDAAVAALLLSVHGLLGKDPRAAIQCNASGLDLGHHHDIVELIEQHQIGLALGATITLLQQGVAALVKVVDGDQLAQHAQFAGTESLDKLGRHRPAVELAVFPTLLELLRLALFACGTHGVSFPARCIAPMMRAPFMRVSTGSKPKADQMPSKNGPYAAMMLHTARYQQVYKTPEVPVSTIDLEKALSLQKVSAKAHAVQ